MMSREREADFQKYHELLEDFSFAYRDREYYAQLLNESEYGTARYDYFAGCHDNACKTFGEVLTELVEVQGDYCYDPNTLEPRRNY